MTPRDFTDFSKSVSTTRDLTLQSSRPIQEAGGSDGCQNKIQKGNPAEDFLSPLLRQTATHGQNQIRIEFFLQHPESAELTVDLLGRFLRMLQVLTMIKSAQLGIACYFIPGLP